MRLFGIMKTAVAAAVVAAVLASCGGGGGSPGLPVVVPPGTGTGTGPGTNPTTPTPTAADLIVSVDKAAVVNSGSDSVTLAVTAVDAARNTVGSVPVNVSVDNNAIFSRTGGAATAENGTFGGKITVGSDKSNRLIKYTVTAGSLTKTGTIKVTGVAVTAAPVPAIPAPGQAVTFTVKVRDSANAAVAGASVAASGIPGFVFPASSTNDSGDATFSFPAPATDGVYPISVQTAGVTTSYDLRVLTAGSTTIPPAVGTVAGVSAIATPVVVATNSGGATTSQSEIRVQFLTTGNSPLPNMRVRFSITSTALPGESLSSGATLVYSDTSGNAKTSYIAATTNSPNNGVVINACYDANDFGAGACPNSVSTRLTVATSPVNLTIGTDNIIQKSASGISYIKKFEVQAVNSAGNYAADVPLSAVVDVQGYWKGVRPGSPPTFTTDDYTVAPSGTTPGGSYKWCPNEDLNRNGVLETGEDINGDSFLTPRQSDVAIGFTSTNRTDATGLATLQLQYPQNLATWLRVKITVTAGVSGSEGAATYVYILRPAEEDAANGSFLTPPYGSSNSCSNAS